MEWKYDIVYNEYQKKYIVFKVNEKHFIAKSIFKSEKRKDCVEYIKKLKSEVTQ